MGTPLPFPQKGDGAPKFSAHVYCGQTAGWIKIILGTEIGLSPGDLVVLDGDPASSPIRGQSPQIFGPCILWPNGWMDQGGTWHGGRPKPRRLCVRWGRSPLPKKGQSPPQFSANFYCAQTAGCIMMPFGMEVGLSPGDFMLDVEQRAPPMFGRATITLGIGPHSSFA